MVLWEMLVFMISTTVCLCFAVTVIADAILNAIDRYKSKRAVKAMKVWSEVSAQIPSILTDFITKMEKNKKYE